MPPTAYALVTLFSLCSVVLGSVAVRLVARRGGPGSRRSYVLPIVGAFLAFYLIGHRLGIEVGPQIPLFGFQVSLFGDLAIGFAAALLVALVQAAILHSRAARSTGDTSPAH